MADPAAQQQILANELSGILSSKLVLLSDPGQSLIASHLYANPESTKLDVVPTLNTRGRLQISTNSMSLGATSTFQIPPGSFLGQCWLVATLDVNRYVHACRGWLLQQIEQVTYQISGASAINNVQMTGESHYDLVMAACRTKEKRDAIISAAGDYINGTAAAIAGNQAACPVFLPWSTPDITGTFPYDTSTLASNIIVEIKWKSGNNGAFMGESAQSPVMPTAFTSLSLKAMQTDIQGSSAFRVSSAMLQNPSMVYADPIFLTQSFTTNQTVTSGTEGNVTLSALPTGQLVGIMCRVSPAAWQGVSGNQNVVRGVGALFNKFNLRYNGQDLVKYDYKKEQQLVDIMMSEGNGYRYSGSSMTAIATATELAYDGGVNFFPLYFDPEGAFNLKHREHVPNYGGSTLEMIYRIDDYALSAAACTFTFTYIFNAVIENQNRVTSVQV
jgi:hypothetical protein